MLIFFQFIVFLSLQILFIPLLFVGFFLVFYKEMIVSKKLDASFTAGQAMKPRWIMHHLKTRPDETTIKFIKVFPAESHFGILCLMGAAIIANRICGYLPALARVPEFGEEGAVTFMNSRTVHFDRIMKKYPGIVEQIVILGAGYDLRVLDLAKEKNVKVFELDHKKTQQLKIETMKKAKIEHHRVTYLPVDFTHKSWEQDLIKQGFDKTKKTLFLWEGVSVYLEEAVVKDTLKKMSDLSAKGSIIAQDFYYYAFLTGEISPFMKRSTRIIKKRGEPFLYGIDMSNDVHETIESILNEFGFVLKELVICGQNGKVGKGKPFYAVTEAEKR